MAEPKDIDRLAGQARSDKADAPAYRVEVVRSDELGSERLDGIFRLFDAGYECANHDYVRKSFSVLRYTSLACDESDELVGFALGDSVETNLSGFDEPQGVALAGISCIDDCFRRRGLFGELSVAAMSARGVLQGRERFLFAGRMAHPITYRTMMVRAENGVPRPGHELTRWQKAVGVEVAALYGVVVDPETFVVQGPGVPIGFPRLEYAASHGESQLFEAVDRSKGESLLSMAWMPDTPPGW